MNALELLKADHRKVEGLFQKVKANEDGDNTDVFEQINLELDVHAQIEEKIFYPRLLEEGDEELKKIVEEGIEEHRQAKMFLRELSNLADDSEKFPPKLQVLMEDIEHHVQEEEGEMFKMVEEQFDEEQLTELGRELSEMKDQLMKGSSSAASGR
jgi:hemerythrin superfamily protein